MRERETLFFNYKKKAAKAKETDDKKKKEEIKNNYRYATGSFFIFIFQNFWSESRPNFAIESALALPLSLPVWLPITVILPFGIHFSRYILAPAMESVLTSTS